MRNKGYLTASQTDESNENYTPFYAVEPILKFIPKDKKVWCPFDEQWSAFYQSFSKGGWSVVRSSLKDGQDFFTYKPDNFDIIVSNPPFNIKDQVLEKLYEIDKPFAMLLPLATLQGKSRYELFKNGIQLLSFDSRIEFHNKNKMDILTSGCCFASCYFCKDLLPDNLVIEKLNKYDEPLL